MTTIGEQIDTALRGVTDLMLRTADIEQVRALARQQVELSTRMQQLIDRELPEATEQYSAATAALAGANTALAQALEDAGQITAGIEAVAQAVDRVVGLVEVLS